MAKRNSAKETESEIQQAYEIPTPCTSQDIKLVFQPGITVECALPYGWCPPGTARNTHQHVLFLSLHTCTTLQVCDCQDAETMPKRCWCYAVAGCMPWIDGGIPCRWAAQMSFQPTIQRWCDRVTGRQQVQINACVWDIEQEC